jgi:excinuclease UvrABC helicase subunit UvrB
MLRRAGKFEMKSDWAPAGDQPAAIAKLVKGLRKGENKQTLLGVTGSGKTFTIANVIQEVQKPTLVIAHNKTLAAQLAQEFKEFFPNNKVHYFVSYYDYYQPEAYVSATDTYIEKDASINEEIDRLRHASTQSILTRNDTIIVASVSCIYGLGSPREYFDTNLFLKIGDNFNKFSLMEALVKIHFERTTADLKSGYFRAVGNRVDINPMSETWMASVFFENNKISNIQILDPVSMVLKEEVSELMFFPAKHFVTDEKSMSKALVKIQKELSDQVEFFKSQPDKLIEAERISRRTQQDIAMMREFGYCSGIENYSRYLAGKQKGEPPETLLSYFPTDRDGKPDFLLVVDESHVTLPQLHGMYAGDQARKKNLVDYGFRLPSAMDNRPLRFQEFEERVGQQIYVSATPGQYEREVSGQVVEQIIRPTGLIDPKIIVKPVLPKKGLTPDPSPSERGESLIKTANIKKYDPLKKEISRMRKNPTSAEDVMWQIVRNNNLGAKFRRQHAIDNFIVDFIALQNQIILEIDGDVHLSQTEKDNERQQVLESKGYRVLRFTNSEVLKNSDKVIEVIIENINKLENTAPLSKEEGLGVRLNYPGQVEDFIEETVKEVKGGGRVLVTTLTKRMAEDLATYLRERKVKAEYIHSDVKTIERIQILTKFRKGDFDCLVGVNLLREGLDLPEVSLIGILDADKEGFLRSETSLIQTIGRAARNVNGRVILYADSETGSMERAVGETNRRRIIQEEYNKKHNITPKTILKSIKDITEGIESLQKKTALSLIKNDIRITGQKAAKLIKQKEREMKEAAKALDFETAAILRDELKELQKIVDGK